MNKSRDNFGKELFKAIIIAIVTAIVTGVVTNYFTKENIIEAICTRFNFVDEKMSYEQALESIYQETESSKNEIKSLNQKINEQNKLINEQNSLITQQNSADEIDSIIQNATQFWNEFDYPQSLILLKNSKTRSEDIEVLYTKYSNEYVSILLSEADLCISQRRYEEAIDLLKEGKILVYDNKMINDKLEEIKSNQPIELSNLKISASRFLLQNKDRPLEDTVGNKYSSANTFVIYAEGYSDYGYATFYLGKKYTSLNGIIAVSDESENRSDTQLEGWVEIGVKSDKGEFNPLWTSPVLSRITSQINISEVDISDSEWLEIRYYNNGDYYSLAGGYHSLRIIVSDVILYTN